MANKDYNGRLLNANDDEEAENERVASIRVTSKNKKWIRIRPVGHNNRAQLIIPVQ